MANKEAYQVYFSIDNLSLKKQEAVFQSVLKVLNYNERQNLHITIKDILGGKHYIWDGYGIDPDGKKCQKCDLIDCYHCPVYESRQKEGKLK